MTVETNSERDSSETYENYTQRLQTRNIQLKEGCSKQMVSQMDRLNSVETNLKIENDS